MRPGPLEDRAAVPRIVPPTLARRLAEVWLERLRAGRLTIEEPGRSPVTYGPAGAPLKATVDIRQPSTWSALVTAGSVGLGTSYMDGWWGTDDLTALVQILIGSLPDDRSRLRRWAGVFRPVLSAAGWRRRGRRRSVDRLNVRAHYDLSNDFFATFLDPTMSYSCAYFESPEDSLEEASRAKIDRLCRKLRLGPGDRLVEVGSGWGALAVHAAENFGAHVTTTTVSEEQHEYVRRLVRERRLTDRIEVLDRDYRELEGRFDKLVSVEMVEALDWRRYRQYFATCSRLLADDGLMALQAIVVSDQAFERSKYRDDFIRRVVFPGGCLPSVTALTGAMTAGSDLRVLELEDIGHHYPPTLSAWRSNLRSHRDQISALGFDLRFQRMWEFYLAYCEAGFLERRISDVQLIMTKPGWRR